MHLWTKERKPQRWNDISWFKESGVDCDYLMLRGIFMPPGVTPDQVAFFIEMFKKVRATPDWKEFVEKGAFKDTFMTGKDFNDWLGRAEATHKALMQEAGFIAK